MCCRGEGGTSIEGVPDVAGGAERYRMANERPIIGLEPGVVRLEDPSPRWAEEYARESARIGAALGDAIEDMRHIGSTSIPSIPAKPIIDIMIGLRRIEDVMSTVEPLRVLGYGYRGEFGIPGRHFFVRGEPPRPATHHVHVVACGGDFWKKNSIFRDYLVLHPELAQEYAEVKRSLAKQFANDRDGYTRGKDAFIRSVLVRAGWRGE